MPFDCSTPPAIVWQAPSDGVIAAGPGVPMQILISDGGWLLEINGKNYGLFMEEGQAKTAGEIRFRSFLMKRSIALCGG